MFDFPRTINSHMAFAGLKDRHTPPFELCCLMIKGKWKLHRFSEGKWIRVNTEMPEDATECSPTAEFADGGWNVSFIAGNAETERRFHLYQIIDVGGKNKIYKICPASVGYVQKNIVVHGKQSGEITVEKPGRQIILKFKDWEFLYRVSYNPFDPQELLMSGQDFDGKIHSRSYHMHSRKLLSLRADGTAAYKAALWENSCFYSKKIGSNFESRQIVRAISCKKEEIPISLLQRIDKKADNIKHLPSEDFE